MRVAVRQLRPGVGDADHRAAVEDEIAEAFSPEVGAVHEAVERLRTEPVATAELLGRHGSSLLRSFSLLGSQRGVAHLALPPILFTARLAPRRRSARPTSALGADTA